MHNCHDTDHVSTEKRSHNTATGKNFPLLSYVYMCTGGSGCTTVMTLIMLPQRGEAVSA